MNDAKIVERPTTTNCGNWSSFGAWWRLPGLLAVVLAAIVLARLSQDREPKPAQPQDATTPTDVDPAGRTASLTIQFGDGKERQFDAVPWHEGMTVDDLMTAASRMPNAFSYKVRGEGEMTLLVQIDGTANEGVGRRNWTYSVNDERADRSLAVYELRPGDRVLWTFGPQE